MQPPGLATKLKDLRKRLNPDLLESMGVGAPTDWFCARHKVEKGPCITCVEIDRRVATICDGLKRRARGQS